MNYLKIILIFLFEKNYFYHEENCLKNSKMALGFSRAIVS